MHITSSSINKIKNVLDWEKYIRGKWHIAQSPALYFGNISYNIICGIIDKKESVLSNLFPSGQ